MSTPLLRITSPYFCASVIPGEKAAPILHYMLLWKPQEISNYCFKKKWRLEIINEKNEITETEKTFTFEL